MYLEKKKKKARTDHFNDDVAKWRPWNKQVLWKKSSFDGNSVSDLSYCFNSANIYTIFQHTCAISHEENILYDLLFT